MAKERIEGHLAAAEAHRAARAAGGSKTITGVVGKLALAAARFVSVVATSSVGWLMTVAKAVRTNPSAEQGL